MVVEADVVLGEAHRARSDVLVGQHRHVAVRRLRTIEARLGRERLTERHRVPASDQPSGGGDPVGAEWWRAPRSSPSPQRSQVETASKIALNSAADTRVSVALNGASLTPGAPATDVRVHGRSACDHYAAC